LSRTSSALAVAAAVLLALAVRVPGVFWGDDFPGGFHGHHVDEWTHVVNAEVLIDPKSPPRWRPNPYPKGLAAHVAVPVLAAQKIAGRDFGAPAETRAAVIPDDRTLILAGRAWSVVYGALSVLVLHLLARRLTGSDGIACAAAFLLALGGLHVSQSHFFVADVPTLFWTLLGTHLLLVDLDARGARPLALPGAAFAFGVAAGLKLSVIHVPSLLILALCFPNRLLRLAQTAAFVIAGAVVVNVASFTPVDLAKTIAAGVASGVSYDVRDVLRIYGIELLASAGIPVVIFAALGLGAALRAAAWGGGARRLAAVTLLIVLPCALQAAAMLRRLDPFPRHLLPFFPWIMILAAAALVLLSQRLARRPALAAAPWILVFGWQAALVADGERGYLAEPRNLAMAWIDANAPKGATVSWPSFEGPLRAREKTPESFFDQGRPDFVVAELYAWNHFVSGAGPRESYPADHRKVFDALSQPRLQAFQDVHRGKGGYCEAARFGEGYVMPELRLADRLLGNRSRNYLTEIVIYRRC
jgi:hypothetical protein